MNIIKTTVAVSLAIAAIGVQARTHAATVTITGNDRAIVAVQNDGFGTIVGAEVFAGIPERGRVIFDALGTDGDLSFAYASRYAVTTWSMDLERHEAQAFRLNLDQSYFGDIPFLPEVKNPGAYSAMRINVLWSDGFEAYIPMSRTLTDAVFTFTDIPVIPAVPEPGAAALLLAGVIGVLAATRRETAKV